MQNTNSALFFLASIACISATATPARAEIEYPWCAVYSAKGGGTNCGFSTLEQCRADYQRNRRLMRAQSIL